MDILSYQVISHILLLLIKSLIKLTGIFRKLTLFDFYTKNIKQSLLY